MRVIDLHTDTPAALLRPEKCGMATFDKTADFTPYLQIAACFCPKRCTDNEGYGKVLEMMTYWETAHGQKNARNAIESKETLKSALLQQNNAYILSIEDARVLAGEIERVDALFALGVRLMTPLWRGVSVIGGAWDTSEGLSPFGAAAAERFLAFGGLIDLSHASRKSHAELLALCTRYGRAPLATHSNAFALTPHPRNLTDGQIREIASLGGVIGLNLYPPFLSAAPQATLDDVLAHARHILNVGGQEVLALGSDFDGVDSLPVGIGSARDLSTLATYMHLHGFTAAEIDAFFFENAAHYLLKNFPQGTKA